MKLLADFALTAGGRTTARCEACAREVFAAREKRRLAARPFNRYR